jgi:hypothetical protein
MQGKHTVDVGVLVIPVLIEMMAFIGDDADIEYVTGTEDDKDTDSVSSSKIALAMKAMKERLPEALEQNDSEDIEETPEEIEQPASGLMSRRM